MGANIKTLQDALSAIDNMIREEANLAGVLTDAQASQIGFIQSMLIKFPLRNCDVGTPEEQYNRHDKYCRLQPTCRKCLRGDVSPMCISCFARWAQRPYEATVQDGDKS